MKLDRNDDTIQIRHLMNDAKLYTNAKTNVHEVYDRSIINSEKTNHRFYLFAQNKWKLLSAKLLNKGACSVIIVGVLNHSFNNHLIGHSEMLKKDFNMQIFTKQYLSLKLKNCRSWSLWPAKKDFCRMHTELCWTVTGDRQLFYALRVKVSNAYYHSARIKCR